MDQILNQLSL